MDFDFKFICNVLMVASFIGLLEAGHLFALGVAGYWTMNIFDVIGLICLLGCSIFTFFFSKG